VQPRIAVDDRHHAAGGRDPPAHRALTLTIVDPTYPGDATCIGDRGGNLGRIPIVPPTFATTLRITAGFQPLLLNITPSYPVK